MKIRMIIAYTMLLTLVLASCRRGHRQAPRISRSEAKALLLRVNQTLSADDRQTIERYVNRRGLIGMAHSATGLCYRIEGDTSGRPVRAGSWVEYRYRISLLDSTVCYEPREPKGIVVGRGGVESGLEEALLLMREGQRALLIVPPHLAHGLAGDGKQIPPRAIIVYEVELLSVEP